MIQITSTACFFLFFFCVDSLSSYRFHIESVTEYSDLPRRRYNLFDSIQDKIVLLMEFDAEKAAELLVNNTARVSVVDVIAQLEAHEHFQFVYLEKLSTVDAHAGRDFGKLQV